ncbi:MAG: hypothetical protein OXP66_13550 [Candidatus Tectomicrobia bacterium]|nr:hypothetical protein [Candidatus Tectomicrobia bacterium]
MNGSQPPKRSGGEDLSPAIALPIMAFGGLGFWWWQLGHRGRMDWLTTIGRESGYPPVPKDMVEQIEWLVENRINDLEGMFLLFMLAAAAGVLEGNARRQAEPLSGFGLRRLQIGRALVLVWLALVALSVAAPVPLPYALVGTVLALSVFGATYNIGRGFRRVH